MAKRLSEEENKRILELYAKCGNYAVVAQLVGRSSTTVAYIVKQANSAQSAKKG